MGKYKYTSTASHYHVDEKGTRKLQVGDIIEMDDDRFAGAGLQDRFAKVEGRGKTGKLSDGEQSIVPVDPTRFTLSEVSDHTVGVDDSKNEEEKKVVSDDELMEAESPAVSGGRTAGQVTGELEGEDEIVDDNEAENENEIGFPANISTMTVPKVKSMIMDATTRQEVRDILNYEQKNLNRAGVITAAENRLQQMGKG